jgi:hypothetical protein
MKDVVLKNRTLNKGDECEYYSSVINGTGATWGRCTVSVVIDPTLKIYKLTEIGTKPREWIVQDIDEKIMIEKAGKDLVFLSWIKTQDET